MAVPKYYEFFPAVMECLKDGKTHTSKETIDFCAKYHRLTQEDLNEKMQSGHGKNTQKNYIKKIFTTQIVTMV